MDIHGLWMYIDDYPSGLRPDRRGWDRSDDREPSVHRTFWKILYMQVLIVMLVSILWCSFLAFRCQGRLMDLCISKMQLVKDLRARHEKHPVFTDQIPRVQQKRST